MCVCVIYVGCCAKYTTASRCYDADGIFVRRSINIATIKAVIQPNEHTIYLICVTITIHRLSLLKRDAVDAVLLCMRAFTICLAPIGYQRPPTPMATAELQELSPVYSVAAAHEINYAL